MRIGRFLGSCFVAECLTQRRKAAKKIQTILAFLCLFLCSFAPLREPVFSYPPLSSRLPVRAWLCRAPARLREACSSRRVWPALDRREIRRPRRFCPAPHSRDLP